MRHMEFYKTPKTQAESYTIIYILTTLELGGAQKVCLSLFEGLNEGTLDTVLITGGTGELRTQYAEHPHIFFIDTLARDLHIRYIWRELCAWWELVRLLRSFKGTKKNIIVHTHSSKAGILGRWAAWVAGIARRIHTVHGFALHTHLSWPVWLLRYSAELITSLVTTDFVCVSRADIRYGARLFPFFERRAHLIRAAVTLDTFVAARTIVTPDEYIIGTISCLKPQKNVADLLRAFAAVYTRDHRLHLEIVGDGEQRAELEALSATLGISRAITWWGWQHDVAPIMRRWKLFVLSSLWEGLPCSIIEARALHIPVISYSTGGIGEIIVHGKNGMLCAQGDWQLLAQHIRRFMADDTLWQKCAQHADELDDFSVAHMIDAHRKLYHSS